VACTDRSVEGSTGYGSVFFVCYNSIIRTVLSVRSYMADETLLVCLSLTTAICMWDPLYAVYYMNVCRKA
jgi:hypothetical protein